MANKFTFDTVFDAETIARENRRRQPVGPPLIYTEQDFTVAVERARREGRATGFAEGRAAGIGEIREVIDVHAAKALEAIARTLPKLEETHRRLALDLRKEATGLALVIARALSHELLKRQPEVEVAAMAMGALATLSELAEQPRTVIKVAPAVLDAVRTLLAKEIAGRPGMKVQLASDPALSGTACRVEWPEGGAERDPAQIERQAAQAVERYLAVLNDLPEFHGPAGATDEGPGQGPDVQAAINQVALAAADQAAAVADANRPEAAKAPAAAPKAAAPANAAPKG